MTTEHDSDIAVETVTKQKTKRPGQWNVLLHNDDFTPMDFVVQILTDVFGNSVQESVAIMLDIHHSQTGVAYTNTKEIAEAKIAEAEKEVAATEFPLRMSLKAA